MKTPREILLARHQRAGSKLDGIRRGVVAEFNAKTQSSQGAKIDAAQVDQPLGVFASLRLCVEKLPQNLWRELIWPCRRTWAGLAAVWLTIAVFNLSHADHNRIVTAESTTPPVEMRLALQEQRRVLAEIIGPGLSQVPVEPPRRPNNQPRSQLRSVAMA